MEDFVVKVEEIGSLGMVEVKPRTCIDVRVMR
jgi:hypothetical protein